MRARVALLVAAVAAVAAATAAAAAARVDHEQEPFLIPPQGEITRPKPLAIYAMLGALGSIPKKGGGELSAEPPPSEESSEESAGEGKGEGEGEGEGEPKPKVPKYGTDEFWLNYEAIAAASRDSGGGCPPNWTPVTTPVALGGAPAVELARKGSRYAGHVSVGGHVVDLVFDTGKGMTWALAPGVEAPGIRRAGPSGSRKSAMPSKAVEVRITPFRSSKSGMEGQLFGMTFLEDIVAGTVLFHNMTFALATIARDVYPNQFNLSGVFGLGHAVDLDPGVTLPNPFRETRKPELVSYYAGKNGGCVTLTALDMHYQKGAVHWYPVQHGPVSWAFRVADMLIGDKSVGLCPGGCSVGLGTGSSKIYMPVEKLKKVYEYIQINPLCVDIQDNPTFTVVLPDGFRVTLRPDDYYDREPGPEGTEQCIQSFQGYGPNEPISDFIVLGVAFVRQAVAHLDGEGMKIGFAEPDHGVFDAARCRSGGVAHKLVKCEPPPPPAPPPPSSSSAAGSAPAAMTGTLADLDCVKPRIAEVVWRCKHIMGYPATETMADWALRKFNCDIDEAVHYIVTRGEALKREIEENARKKKLKRTDLVPLVQEEMETIGFPADRELVEKALDATRNDVHLAVDYLLRYFVERKKSLRKQQAAARPAAKSRFQEIESLSAAAAAAAAAAVPSPPPPAWRAHARLLTAAPVDASRVMPAWRAWRRRSHGEAMDLTDED
jgi:hypothetical protein